jgi:hypothetical protein
MRCVVEYNVDDGGDIMGVASEVILAYRYLVVLALKLLNSSERNSTNQKYTTLWITANRVGSK